MLERRRLQQVSARLLLLFSPGADWLRVVIPDARSSDLSRGAAFGDILSRGVPTLAQLNLDWTGSPVKYLKRTDNW